jgi:drug/metabolite transporter (DMT)-like permease
MKGGSILAGLIILAAAVLAMSPGAVGGEATAAMLIALSAPLSFGFAINILTNKLIRIPPLSRIACVTLGAALGLLPLVVALDAEALLPGDGGQWWLIGGIAIATALLPQLIYTVSAPRIGAARTAMAGSVELPTMFLVGWLGFGESIGPMQLIAAGMVLAAIVITPVRRPAAPRR